MHKFKENIFKTTNDSTFVPPTLDTWHFSSPGRVSSGLACNNITFTNTWYTAYTGGTFPALGATVYHESSLSTVVDGQDFWYNLQEAFIEGDPFVYQIGVSGTLDNFFSCP
jgi:hypothetical protein